MELDHQYLDTGDVTLHLACAGEGPLVVLCHGYPGLWYSWRHQLPAIAAAGYRVVAMDSRGYGRSSRPVGREHYSLDKTSADVLAVFDHFKAEKAELYGHDFGANLAWHMAVHYPGRLRGVGSLCVPYDMALPGGADVRPSELYAQVASEHFFHMHYYQQVGIPEDSCRGREREYAAREYPFLYAPRRSPTTRALLEQEKYTRLEVTGRVGEALSFDIRLDLARIRRRRNGRIVEEHLANVNAAINRLGANSVRATQMPNVL